MPPSRGKSCAACTKAKRRCDFALPSCLRCSARGIECVYPQRTRSSLMRMAQPSPSARPSSPPASASPPVPPARSMSPGLFCSTLSLDEILTADPDFSGSLYGKDLSGAFLGGDAPWRAGEKESPAALFPSDEGGSESIPMDSSGLDGGTDAMEPTGRLPLTTSPGQTGLSDLLADRVRFAAAYLDSIPKTLVQTLGTPWCHPELFKRDAPKCLKDMIAYSALYTSKTPETKSFVMKTLISNLTELSKSPIPQTHAEALARAHSLGMYHIMALFDGDIESRATAEALLPQLELSTDALVPHITYDDLTDSAPRDLPLFPLAGTEMFWRSWLLQESTRRTWLFTNQVALIYSHLAGRKTGGSAGAGAGAGGGQCRSWCIAGPLWRAGNAVDFAVAWGEGRRLVARMDRLEEVFAEARPGDLDEFGRMLLACYMGEHEARGWMAVNGGGLGLEAGEQGGRGLY